MVAKRATSTSTASVARESTDFEKRLHELCKCIPKGKVTTYGAMAKVLSSAPRAVGQVGKHGHVVRQNLPDAACRSAFSTCPLDDSVSDDILYTPRGHRAQSPGLTPKEGGIEQALRRNPYAPVVPCHRVIASDRKLGGFKGGWGEENHFVCDKRVMLKEEGVEFDDGKVSVTSMVAADDLAALLTKVQSAPDASTEPAQAVKAVRKRQCKHA